MPNFSFAPKGQRLASVKTSPFAMPQQDYQRALGLARTQGPILQARPIEEPTVAVLYSDPREGERARSLFSGIMKTRLDRFATNAAFVLTAVEEVTAVARALDHLLRARPSIVLMASTTAPAGPDDVIGQAMRKVGCDVESFLAPVEPGNLLLLSYAGDVPVVAAPGCFRVPQTERHRPGTAAPTCQLQAVRSRDLLTRSRRSADLTAPLPLAGRRSRRVGPRRFARP